MADAPEDNIPPVDQAVTLALAGFLASNPLSELRRLVGGDLELNVIWSPWGESSLILPIPNNIEQFAENLNNLYLHPRLSAVLHRDTNDLEIIWTAYKAPASITDIYGRRFKYRFEGIDYICEFSDASARILNLARIYEPVGPSETNYRNLLSFKRFLSESEETRGQRFGAPSSFWIRNIRLNDDDLIEFVHHLNFYLSYYDNKTPIVLVHPPRIPTASQRIRFRHGKFPESISGKRIDTQLLQFWAACGPADSARRFLYAYRIIEHAAFFFVESAPKLAVRKILAAPHASDDIDRVTQEIITAIQKSKWDDYAKLEGLLTQTVDPAILWQEIEAEIEAFSKETTFDGDFKLPALVANGKGKEEFMLNGIRTFCNVSRKIRNALSHGKEERTAAVITPTTANYAKLAPWAHLMRVAAGEVILYEAL